MSNDIVKYNDTDLLSPEVNFEDKISIATRIANPLASFINERELYVKLGGKKHVLVEGWNSLGTMLGLAPMTVHIRPLEEHEVKTTRSWDKVVGYEAEVEIRTAEGTVISNAKSICTNLEKGKENNDHYAIWSMAETRAKGKAYRSALSWVMELAGYAPTPAEEMPPGGFNNTKTNPKKVKKVKKTVEKEEPKDVQDADFKTKKPVKEDVPITDTTPPKTELELEQEKTISNDKIGNEAINRLIQKKETINTENLVDEVRNMVGEEVISPAEAGRTRKLIANA